MFVKKTAEIAGKTISIEVGKLARLAQGAELNPPDFGSFYTPGEKGYTDYPTLGG